MREKKRYNPTRVLSILPLRNTVVFPGTIIPLAVGRPKSIKLIDDALAKDKIIGIVTQKDPQEDDPDFDGLYSMGAMAQILKLMKLPDGSQNVVIQGLNRFRIIDFLHREPYIQVTVDIIEESFKRDVEINALEVNLKNMAQKALELIPNVPSEMTSVVKNMDDPGKLADLICSNLNISVENKEDILEAIDIKARLRKVITLLSKEIQVLELSSKIQSQVRSEIDKTQREYYLREQMKAIQKELGETDERGMEIEELKKKIAEAMMPPEVEKEAKKELDRLAKMPPAAAEYTVSRTYLDWLVELPWAKNTTDNLDIEKAEIVLEEDHYNLEKVKKRILEYLAVRKLKADMKGPILCFVGPPGVGKTSLGKSIARALSRKFIRISLGGVRDEAEIRGHRRTYVGALPGRVIQGIKKASSNNPVFMLDEIDKVGTDFRGDPSAALLEVLDPEQNNAFSDHYLNVPFDLSKVMFITTANILEPIPPALKDRMEVLELPGYTEEEKVMIAQKFLIPKQLEEHGITSEQLHIHEDAIRLIISSYTREAGVRNLEREIAAICRGIAKEVAKGNNQHYEVTTENVPKFLGPIKFFSEVAERTSITGVATGLAWTPSGGDIIFVEATKMRGKGKLNLTGQLGDIMKESAQAALSYLRSKAKDLNIDEEIFEKQDIHIHVPAGAIPKDGPSAGVTIYTALVSLLLGRPVRNDAAMTGEITLRGMVLPVGGIKEKILAAKRAGIRCVILPEKNQKDMVDVPEKGKEGMEFEFVKTMDEVIENSLRSPDPESSNPSD